MITGRHGRSCPGTTTPDACPGRSSYRRLPEPPARSPQRAECLPAPFRSHRPLVPPGAPSIRRTPPALHQPAERLPKATQLSDAHRSHAARGPRPCSLPRPATQQPEPPPPAARRQAEPRRTVVQGDPAARDLSAPRSHRTEAARPARRGKPGANPRPERAGKPSTSRFFSAASRHAAPPRRLGSQPGWSPVATGRRGSRLQCDQDPAYSAAGSLRPATSSAKITEVAVTPDPQ